MKYSSCIYKMEREGLETRRLIAKTLDGTLIKILDCSMI
jgi:hypothetical protein